LYISATTPVEEHVEWFRTDALEAGHERSQPVLDRPVAVFDQTRR
jgi:hypothetical protein